MNQAPPLPDPLVPAEVDLRGLEYMPLLGGRLFSSDFDLDANDAEFRIGLKLWWAAWNQVPAASLPSEDHRLRKLAGLEENVAKWRKVKERALHGFFPCSDGRLYHPIVAEQALIAWDKRGEIREERANEAERQRRSRAERKRMFDELRAVGVTPKWDIGMSDLRALVTQHITPPVTVTGPEPVTPPVTGTATAKTGRDETGQEKKESPPPTEDLVGAGKPELPDQPPDHPPPAPPPPPPPPAPPAADAGTAYGAITRALRLAGLSKAHPGNQRLRMLVDAGATEAEFLAMVPRALAEGDEPFAYLLAALEGERTRAKARADQLHRGPMPGSEPPDWREDRNEVIRKGIELGLGPYEPLDHATGQAIAFTAYRRRVIAAAAKQQPQGAPA